MHRTDTTSPVASCQPMTISSYTSTKEQRRHDDQRDYWWKLKCDIQQHLLYQGTKQSQRVRLCCRRKAQKHDPRRVQTRQSTTTGRYKANFQNMRVCGSVWLCPNCSQKIRDSVRATSQLYFNDMKRVVVVLFCHSFRCRTIESTV